MPQIRPAAPPAARNEARDPGNGSRHAAALAARSTLLSDRPAVSTAAVTDLAEFPDQGDSLTIDSGWRAVADDCLSWLAKQEL